VKQYNKKENEMNVLTGNVETSSISDISESRWQFLLSTHQ